MIFLTRTDFWKNTDRCICALEDYNDSMNGADKVWTGAADNGRGKINGTNQRRQSKLSRAQQRRRKLWKGNGRIL